MDDDVLSMFLEKSNNEAKDIRPRDRCLKMWTLRGMNECLNTLDYTEAEAIIRCRKMQWNYNMDECISRESMIIDRERMKVFHDYTFKCLSDMK